MFIEVYVVAQWVSGSESRVARKRVFVNTDCIERMEETANGNLHVVLRSDDVDGMPTVWEVEKAADVLSVLRNRGLLYCAPISGAVSEGQPLPRI